MVDVAEPALKALVIWILVANDNQAQIYTRKKGTKSISRIGNAKRHHHDEINTHELVPVGTTVYAVLSEPHIDVTEGIRERFAKSVAEHLNKTRARLEFNRLVLIASPQFLSELRKHLSKTVKGSVIAELAIETLRYANGELAKCLEDIV